MKTLNEILKENPEWGDLPVAIYAPQTGEYDMLGGIASVYIDKRDESDVDYEGLENEPVLVFSGN